ncbi:MAG: WbqC family protein [Paludibacteraceae bacterium]|nr:WbqC family protein [Paludibacteraceae bacterium]
MKLAIMQPYFMPYIGYFQTMAAVDTYVVYDDVQYIKGGWVSRNNIIIGGEKKMFTIILKGASPNKLFNEVEIGDDFKKFERMLQSAYAKAPYFHEIMPLLHTIFTYDEKSLGKFLLHSYQVLLDYLEIPTQLVLSSDLVKDSTLRGQDKVLNICKNIHATEYYNAIGGQELYDKKVFAEHGIKLSFVQTEQVAYLQFAPEFIPNLSIIDVLMHNGKEGTKQLLNAYTLI